jgi:hypothetical protein
LEARQLLNGAPVHVHAESLLNAVTALSEGTVVAVGFQREVREAS